MANGRKRRWGEYVTSIPVERILSVLPDATPRTTSEIAADAGVTEHTARNRLEDLRDEGRVDRRELDIDERSVTLWWVTADEHVARSTAEAEVADREEPSVEDVEDALAALELPGASDLMREWRRDAVRAAYWHLVEHGPMGAEAVQEGVYPSHRAGYSDRETWWEMVHPRLGELPGVTAPRWPGQPWEVATDEDDGDPTAVVRTDDLDGPETPGEEA